MTAETLIPPSEAAVEIGFIHRISVWPSLNTQEIRQVKGAVYDALGLSPQTPQVAGLVQGQDRSEVDVAHWAINRAPAMADIHALTSVVAAASQRNQMRIGWSAENLLLCLRSPLSTAEVEACRSTALKHRAGFDVRKGIENTDGSVTYKTPRGSEPTYAERTINFRRAVFELMAPELQGVVVASTNIVVPFRREDDDYSLFERHKVRKKSSA